MHGVLTVSTSYFFCAFHFFSFLFFFNDTATTEIYTLSLHDALPILHIDKMMYKMKHRGPNDKGKFIDKNFGFGFVRLSILDLSPLGHQPMFDDSNRYMIVHNGDRKSTRLNSSHIPLSRMPSSA